MKLTNFSKNMVVSECSVGIKLLMQFVVRTVFLHQLAMRYLGASDLFATIVSILSVAQMGFGNALKYAMYRPIASGDSRTVKAIMDFYRRVYQTIGVCLVAVGFGIYPLLQMVRGEEMSLRGMLTAYVFLMLDMVTLYFYKGHRDLLIASQKEYISNLGEMISFLIQGALQVYVLTALHSFPLYFAAKFVGNLFLLIWNRLYASKLHPCLKTHEKPALGEKTRRDIFRDMKANMLDTIGITINDNLDYLLAFFTGGLGQVGILSNFKLMTNSVTQFLCPLFNSALGPLGHLGVTSSPKKMLEYFNVFQLMSFWCFGFSSIALLCLMNPFVTLWAGMEYTVSEPTILLIVLVFFSNGVNVAVGIFRDALGLFWVNRYRKILASLLNLVFSLILVRPLGILGLFLGTLLSDLCITFWMNPYNLYRYGFQAKVSSYFKRYALYFLLLTAAAGVTVVCCSLTEGLPQLPAFLLDMVICTTVPNLIIFLGVHRTPEFSFVKRYMVNILQHKSHRK